MTASPAELNAQYEYQDIDAMQIDEPENPERETMDPEYLAELALDIQANGLIKPLIVKRVGDRFEVVAGHRRLLACRLAEYSPIPCRIRAEGAIDHLAILVAENAHWEKVNPVEEARFYRRVLIEKADNDVDALCLIVRRKREYVEDRLLLLIGWPEVVEALQEKKIGIAVARELNKLRDPDRLRILLDVSITQGATARQVGQWRREAENAEPIGLAPDTSNGEGVTPTMIMPTFEMRCLVCDSTEHAYIMEMFYAHKPCKSILNRMLGHHAPENGNGQG